VIAVCVLAKPPLPGIAKTRLAETVGSAEAAALCARFIADTYSHARRCDGAVPIASVTALHGCFSRFAERWLQGEGDLGARIERTCRRALSHFAAVIALGADTPHLPSTRIERAARLLQRYDAVIGPSDDGGFYLLGLRRCPPKLFASLPWSTKRSCAAMAARLREMGLRTAFLHRTFDVDRIEDLHRLKHLLSRRPELAPITAAGLW
jgi:uncharacterized protein